MKTKATVISLGSLLAALLLVLLVAAPVWAASPLFNNQTLTIPENSSNGTSTSPANLVAGDPQGQTLTFTVLGGNGVGVFDVSSSGAVTLISGPLDYETGPKSYTLNVRATNTIPESTDATVTINVADESDEPVSMDNQEFDVPMNSPNGSTVGTLVVSDEDVDDSFTFTIDNGNGNPPGAFNIDDTGKITVKDTGQLDGVKTFTLSVTVKDEGDTTDTADIKIDVTNTSPTVTGSGIPDVIVNEGASSKTINLRDFFEDAEDPDTELEFAIHTITGDPLFSSAPSINPGTDVLTLNFAPGGAGIANITIRVTDTAGETVDDTFKVDVNDTPNPVGYSDVTVTEDAPNTQVNLYTGFTDSEQPSSSLTYAIVDVSNPGLFSAPSPNIVLPNLVLDYAPDTNGQSNITIRATDSGGLFAETTFNVKVNAANDPPTTSGIANVNVDEDAPNTVINLFSAFDDTENDDDELTYSVTGNSNQGLFESVTINGQTGQLTLDYKANESGEANLTVRATDKGGLFVEAGFKVTVGAVNDKPTVTDFGKATAEDLPVQFTLNDFASHFNDPDGNELAQVRVQSLPADGTLKLDNDNVSLNQVIPAAQLDDLAFIPAPNWDQGATSFNWNASDGTDYAAEPAKVTITITAQNDAPIVTDFNKIGDEGVSVLFARSDFENVFSDVDGDTLDKIRIENLPDNGTLKLNGVNVTAKQQINVESLQQLSFVPDAFWAGETTFNWSGSDGTIYSSPAKVIITINPKNDAPALDLNGDGQGTGFTSIFVAGGNPVLITGQTLTITDIDSETMQGATIIIVNRKNGSKELLSANAQGTNINVNFNAGSGILFLDGVDTIANYEKVLKTVKYQIASDVTNPDPAQRSISFRVNDGELNSNDALAKVNVINPRISVSVEPPFQTVPKGTTVVFTITIENTGDVDLENIKVTSEAVPDCNRNFDELDAGETLETYACVVSNVTERIDNEVKVTAQDAEVGSAVADDDEAVVRVLQDVSINIAPDPVVGDTLIKGQNAAFNVLVVNPSDSKLKNVQVKAFIDYDVGVTINTPSELVPAPACDFVIGDLNEGQQKTYSCTIPNVQASFSIEVQVTAETAAATDTEDFDIAEIGVLDLTLEVFSDPFEILAGQPTTVEFNLTLANVSNVPLTLSSLDSDIHGNLLNASNSNISANTCPSLNLSIPEGEVRSCSYELTLILQPPAITNMITAVVVNEADKELTVTDEAIVSVNDFSPLEVVLGANPSSLIAPGGEVNLTVQITNNTSAELTLDALNDSVVGNLDGKGNCEIPQPIPGSGSYSCTYPVMISGKSAGDVVTHVITATADSEEVSDSVAIPITSVAQTSLMLPAVSSGGIAGEPNNSICKALPIMANLNHYYLADDANDWYKFTLESPANVRIRLSGYLARGQIVVFTGDCAGPVFIKNNGNFETVKEIDLGLLTPQPPVQTYYIWVLSDSGFNSVSPYVLRVDVTTP